MQKEIWKDIPNYEGLYQVSNLGRVMSLKSRRINIGGKFILKNFIDKYMYSNNYLYKDFSRKRFKTHQLVAMAFLSHTPCGNKLVVDHINDDKLDNRLENLQIVISRFNAYKTQDKYISKYKGVTWSESGKKWKAKITINNKCIHIGVFSSEEEASQAYQNKLKEINV